MLIGILGDELYYSVVHSVVLLVTPEVATPFGHSRVRELWHPVFLCVPCLCEFATSAEQWGSRAATRIVVIRQEHMPKNALVMSATAGERVQL